MRLPYSTLRALHLALGPLLGLFVHAPNLRNDPLVLGLVQFGLFPAVALAGLALWLGRRVARRARAAAPQERAL